MIDAFEAKGQCWRVIADRPVEAISAELKSLVSSKLLSGVVSSTRTSTKTSNKRKGPEPRHVRVGGVPEHFNAPWHLAMRRGAFASVGAFVDWTVYPGGTGDMAKAVSERAVDVALMLTEGTVVAALKDPRIKVVGVFVSTPAVWGIHVGAASCQQAAIADMKESANFAVSRMGSGSHLMAYVLAESLGWPLDKLQFTVVGNLKGALEQLPKNGDLVFMWEKFTTLPHVVDGTLKRVGEFPTPWPFFVVAANADFLQEEGSPALLREVLKVVKAEAMRFKAGGKRTLDYIKQHHQIEHGPAQEWLPTVEWGLDGEVPLDMLRDVANVLHRVGKIDGALPSDAAIAGITAELGWASEQKRAK